jgi:hypothetical protein
MDDASFDHNAMYDEDDDASVVVNFQNTDLYMPSPEKFRSTPQSNPASPSSSNDGFPSASNHQTDDLAIFQLYEDDIIDETPLKDEHRMWEETCGALRHFGTFAVLPLDVQFIILDYCGPSTLLTIRKANHLGRLIGMQDRFWQRLCIQDFSSDERIVPDRASWMKNYKEGYKYYKSGTVSAFGMGMPCIWQYHSNQLWIAGSVPMRRWRWSPKNNVVFMPNMRTASWNPDTYTLSQHGGQFFKKCTYNPASNRFSNTDGTTHATITQTQLFPPKYRILILTAHSMSHTLFICGAIPIPILMTIIFRLE